MNPFFSIPEYHDFLSQELATRVLASARPVDGAPGLASVGQPSSALETREALAFVRDLYLSVHDRLAAVLRRRRRDRRFIDQRARAANVHNLELGLGPRDARYATALGLEDADGRIVLGPLRDGYDQPGGAPIAPLPKFLEGPHVTLFGPPDTAKMAINAVNSYYRRLPGEPPIVEELLLAQNSAPMWGADDEDSKTPLHEDLVDAAVNLSACFDGTLIFNEGGKTYALEATHRALPIKRFPGLALPSTFLFYERSPIPLHLYDFALHVFRNHKDPRALVFYVPKLENEEEAAYVHEMVASAEKLLRARDPSYSPGTIRLMIVLENPRAILRAHEIIDELHPYFAGASLGWHDYLASTARLMKEHSTYRIPVKADPNIVIKHIRASHRLLASVVGSRGGIKVGGMYGILPIAGNRDSLQVTLKGFLKDVLTQLSRELTGFWVAHPDFVRLGLAVVEAWRRREAGEGASLLTLVRGLLDERQSAEIQSFLSELDAARARPPGRDSVRALIVADLELQRERGDPTSGVVRNDDPDEIRYNVFQTLQYLADWLAGNGCVALPTVIEGVPVRVMDDLATAERSRWEVWHEVHHGRFAVEDLIRIAREELDFIRRDRSGGMKLVQVKWNERSARWYPIAYKLMLQLMTADEPPEFATELLLPFTTGVIREAADPWAAATSIDPVRYRTSKYVADYDHYFEICGAPRFAEVMARNSIEDAELAESTILSFSKAEVLAAARFHGDIGQSKKTLDARAASEQATLGSEEAVLEELRTLGQRYLERFGFKFLVPAKGRSGSELLTLLRQRYENDEATELHNARRALFEISRRRIADSPRRSTSGLEELRRAHGVVGVSIAINCRGHTQTICLGESRRGVPVTPGTHFELASLSKTLASAFVLEELCRLGAVSRERIAVSEANLPAGRTAKRLRARPEGWRMEIHSDRAPRIPLDASVNELLARSGSTFRLSSGAPEWADRVVLRDLLSHTALNMHYVNGFPASEPLPPVESLLRGGHGYPALEVVNPPGRVFGYSGGGFLVLQHLVELLGAEESKADGSSSREHRAASVGALTSRFLESFGELTFDPGFSGDSADGFFDSGEPVVGGRYNFPAFAAGGLGSARGLARFLHELSEAYGRPAGSKWVSHDTAVQMLHGSDKGCRAFMGCEMGLGVFVAEAGGNRFAIHQGANEGFRAIYLQCFAGPDRGKGLVVLANSDNRAVPFIAAAVRQILEALEVDGVDFDQLSSFSLEGLPEEQIVNLGYKALIVDSFRPDLPEAIEVRGPRDPLAGMNLVVGAKIRSVTNQRFARAENLISPFLPRFDPELFGRQGKIMDSWESARHNPLGEDALHLELATPSAVRFVSLSTKYHDGNQAEHVRLEGLDVRTRAWVEILPKTRMAGHSSLRAELPTPTPVISEVRVLISPDGGLTRLGLFEALPEEERSAFSTSPACVRFPDAIPKTRKPLTLPYSAGPGEIDENLRRVSQPDWASAAFGGAVVRASNEHYGPAKQVISPFPPLHMFDGLESARSRDPGHHEEVVIRLGKPITIGRVVLDFEYFVNNNPREISVLGAFGEGPWVELVPRTGVKAYAGNWRELRIERSEILDRVLVRTYPDGGINRIHVYSAEP
ncbi:MAG: serine hydrolase [Deltaproteobacteria bacterium]|nr:serine hydrolase [Deltaproteobacteria bacterium]